MDKYLCIDIGGTFIKYGILSKDGTIVKKDKFLTPSNKQSMLLQLIKIIDSESSEIKGISVSCPGKIDSKTGIVSFGGKIPYLHNTNLVEAIRSVVNSSIPVTIINDGKAALLAEFWQGNLKNYNNGISFILGSAVGGGIILDGKILHGSNFQAGEFSFMPFKLTGEEEVVTVGNIGDQLSAVRFIERVAGMLGDSNMDGEQVFEAIRMNSNIAIRELENYARNIAFYLLSLHAVLDLDAIVIGGGISVQDRLIREINQQVDIMMNEISGYALNLQKPIIQACRFHNDSNLIGALYYLLTND